MSGLDALSRMLSRHPEIEQWVAQATRHRESQRYTLARRPESARTVESDGTRVRIWRRNDAGLGEAAIALPGRGPRLETAQLDQALFRASLQASEPWSLPAGQRPAAAELADPALRDGGRVAAELEARLHAAVAREADVRLAAAEFFVQRRASELLSSTGVRCEQEVSELELEIVLVAARGGDEAEALISRRVRRLADLDLEGLVASRARHARDRLRAVRPPTRVGPVVIPMAPALPLFNPIRSALSAESLYRELSRRAVGEPLLRERKITGDRLTLGCDPLAPALTESARFDAEGLALGRRRLVDAGEIVALSAAKRFADYLELEPTGDWRNIVVEPGTTPAAELVSASDGPVLEVVEFSWLNPDDVRGDFSTEIRLGYLHTTDGVQPVSGGSLSGNVYDAFAGLTFASEVGAVHHCRGPVALRCEQLQVTA